MAAMAPMKDYYPYSEKVHDFFIDIWIHFNNDALDFNSGIKSSLFIQSHYSRTPLNAAWLNAVPVVRCSIGIPINHNCIDTCCICVEMKRPCTNQKRCTI